MSKTRAAPAAGQARRGEGGHIGYLLRQAHAGHRVRMERALAASGVTLAQFSVLTMLAAYPGASGAELARLSLLTPQTVSLIVANLEKLGALTRRPHEVHGRIRVIELSAEGRRLLARCKAAVREPEALLLEGLTAAEEELVRRWLVRAATAQSALD